MLASSGDVKEGGGLEGEGKKSPIKFDRSIRNADIYIEELVPPNEPLLNIFTFGWMEDGRLGYPADIESFMQDVPRPIATLRHKEKKKTLITPHAEERYVCKKVSAGYRHTLFLMTNCYPEIEQDEDGDSMSMRSPSKSNFGQEKRKKCRLMMTGLNQRGLCEEPGFTEPVNLGWDDKNEDIVDIYAGNGTSFIVTRIGNLYAFGNNRYGILGTGDEVSIQIPKQCLSLNKVRVARICCGSYHAIATSDDGILYSWGRNQVGQLGLGFESEMELQPAQVVGLDWSKENPTAIDCGHEFTLMLLTKLTNKGEVKRLVYGWGDHSRGQLGSGDEETRCKPQENRWMTKLCIKYGFYPTAITCGSHHVLVLSSTGQVISWGAGEYGQLGHGSMWDMAEPRVINDLKGVSQIAAGARHSVALVPKVGVMSWGYNGYGELGLGDVNIRTQPTTLSAFTRALIKQITCGDRHTVVVTSHRAIMANEDPALRPYFTVVEENVNEIVKKQLKVTMEKAGFDR